MPFDNLAEINLDTTDDSLLERAPESYVGEPVSYTHLTLPTIYSV